jgi:hypothetical protein
MRGIGIGFFSFINQTFLQKITDSTTLRRLFQYKLEVGPGNCLRTGEYKYTKIRGRQNAAPVPANAQIK